MCEISIVDASSLELLSNKASSVSQQPTERLLKLSHFCWLSHPFDFLCTTVFFWLLQYGIEIHIKYNKYTNMDWETSHISHGWLCDE